MRVWFGVIICIWVCIWGGVVYGQPIQCQRVEVNNRGVSNAAVAVNNSSVNVADGNSNRCSLLIHNSGVNNMTCAPNTIVVSATSGYVVAGGAALALGEEGKQQWNCYSETGTTAQVVEGKP